MLEKVKEKMAFMEVLQEIAEHINRIEEDYKTQKEHAQENYDNADPERDWWKESYINDVKNYERKISAIEKISDYLLKLM